MMRSVIELDPADVPGFSWIVVVAWQVGICKSLLQGAATVTEHADRLGLNVTATERVLNVLAVIGLAERFGDTYAASAPLVDIQQFTPFGIDGIAHLWEQLRSFLIEGRLAGGATPTIACREENYRAVAKGLWTLFEAPAQRLATSLTIRPRNILDIGTGSGVWSLTLARLHTDAHVTGLDLPRVLDVFVDRAEAMGMSDRIELLPGDYQSIVLPRDRFDVIILANVLHLEPALQARVLLTKAAKALMPQGTLVIVDIVSGDGPEWQTAKAIYSLSLSMRTGSGGLHARADLEQWISENGLSRIDFIRLGSRRDLLGALVGSS